MTKIIALDLHYSLCVCLFLGHLGATEIDGVAWVDQDRHDGEGFLL